MFPSLGRLQFPEAHGGDGIPQLCGVGHREFLGGMQIQRELN